MILLHNDLVRHIQRKSIVFEQAVGEDKDSNVLTDWTKVGPNSLDITIAPWIRRRQQSVPPMYYPWTDAPDTYWADAEFHKFIEVRPHETILAHSNEIVGSTQFVPIFVQRSGLGRIGQGFMAGFGDIGYIAPWTLEFTNHLETKVIIPAGVRVGQIYFLQGAGEGKLYAGSYGKRDWDVSDMLPKLHNDARRTIYGWPVERAAPFDDANKTPRSNA